MGSRCGSDVALLGPQGCRIPFPCGSRPPAPWGSWEEAWAQRAACMLGWQFRRQRLKSWVNVCVGQHLGSLLGESSLRYRLPLCKYSPQPAQVGEERARSELAGSLFRPPLKRARALGSTSLWPAADLRLSFLSPTPTFFSFPSSS